ncbi:MAG TPA: EAL domain-containing protein [Solirubrobacterales bacterium]|nr:EAL domain-containing protein [Solirubrobacterales bacterium]
MAPDEQRARRTDRFLRLAGDGTAADGQAAAQLGEAAVTLLEGSPEGIAIVDGSGLIVYWNGAAEQQFGLERSRALGQELASLIFPDHLQASVRAVLLREIDEPGEGLGQRRIELGARRADGREIPVDIATKPVELDGSRWLAVYLDDASERSERERELHADARRRSAVLDLGQSALEGMDMDQLLKRAVALTIDELGVDRCEVWRRDDDGSSMTLRASSGWPEEAAGTRVPLVTSTQPGYTLLRGQGAIVVEDFRREGRFGAVGPDDAASPQSSISIRIPGTSGGFGSLVAASETLRRFELSDISLFVSLAQTLGAAIERARAIDSLADAERQIRTLIERLPSITYRAGLGARGEWYFISPQVEEITGYTVEEWMADPGLWERAVHPDDIDWVLEAEDQSGVDGKPLDVAYRIRKRDGEMIWVRDRASVGTVDENGVLIAEGLITDISEQRAAEDRLRYLAEHDELTGLMNRRCFEVAVDREIGSNRLPGERGAMVIIDLDHLKRVNDTLGRSTGDRVVADIAKMLADDIGAGQLLSRLDSDEFGVLIPGVGEAQALERAGSLLAMIRARTGTANLTASAGVALVERGMGVSATDLITAADIALHQAKEAGRDRAVIFTGEDRSRLEWVGHVRQAIEEGGLVLFSQPIIDMASGLACAEELLVRMVDPVSGRPISAGEFVPTAERFGLARNLDHWVVTEALDLITAGRHVSANISAATISDRSLTEKVAASLAETGADPSLLTFEITETAATPAIESLRDFTDRVEALGCGLSLDDVGTGFGSLTYLRHLPFTELKIDMQFVHGVIESAADRKIVESLVDIASGLGMRTVAEGVDNPALVEPLREIGVTCVQGYLFGRPAPIVATTA